MWKILLCIGIVFYASIMIHFCIEIWQAYDIKEEKSTPIYIKKEL